MYEILLNYSLSKFAQSNIVETSSPAPKTSLNTDSRYQKSQ